MQPLNKLLPAASAGEDTSMTNKNQTRQARIQQFDIGAWGLFVSHRTDRVRVHMHTLQHRGHE